MTKPNSTEIIFVVDRSGSMSSIAADMRGGFDTFLAEQRKIPGECKVTLAQFDDVYDLVYEGRSLDSVPALELTPRGSTALLDAIGRTIDVTGRRLRSIKESERPSKVLFVIITDGQENCSREYTRERIFEMISHQRDKYAWDFVFIGANQDAIKTAVSYGMKAGNAVNYVATAGVRSAGVMRGLSNNVAQYRTGKGLGDLQASYDIASRQVDTPNPVTTGTPDPTKP